jgi:hypothetical protein
MSSGKCLFPPQCSPGAYSTAWRTGPGTSFGHEEKQETKARQRIRGSFPLCTLRTQAQRKFSTIHSLIAEETDTNTKRPLDGLFVKCVKGATPLSRAHPKSVRLQASGACLRRFFMRCGVGFFIFNNGERDASRVCLCAELKTKIPTEDSPPAADSLIEQEPTASR